ncbi:hypothetical protein EDC01DRAFT_650219 [Geopyxis carbonaria]|nr:hypothetical protein EDC01DRAFT_650219 [Geopyxis carbonaria]
MKLLSLLSTALMVSAATATTFDMTDSLRRRAPGAGAPVAPIRASTPIPVATLLPVDEYSHPVLGKRAPAQLAASDIAPTPELSLQWASKVNDGTLYRAKMNVTAPDTKTRLLTMSSFAAFTESVDCSTTDGDGLSITFAKAEYLETAKKAWGWVSNAPDNKFWLVTNHKDCPRADGEQQYGAYEVTDVEFGADGRTAEFVKAKKTTLEAAVKDCGVDLRWGSQRIWRKDAIMQAEGAGNGTLTRRDGHIYKRGWPWNWIEDNIIDPIEENIIDPIEENIIDPIKDFVSENWNEVVERFGDAADKVKDFINDAGSFEKGDKWDLDMAVGEPGKVTRLGENILPGPFELSCIDCYVKGKFEVEGKIKMEALSVKEASWSVSPEDFLVRMQLQAKLPQSEWSVTTVPIFSIPFAAIDIPVLFHFGPEFRIDAEFGLANAHDIDFTFGWEASLPNDAYVKSNFVDLGNSEAPNWDKASAKALDFEVSTDEIDVDLSVSLMAVLSFGYDIFSLGGYEAALKAPLPNWKANITSSIHEDGGACGEADAKTEIKMDHSLSCGLNFYVGPNLSNGENALVNKEIFSVDFPLDSTCTSIVDDITPSAGNETAGGNSTTADFADDPDVQAAVKDLEEQRLAEEAELDKLDIMREALYEDGYIPDGMDVAGPGMGSNGTVPSGSGMGGNGTSTSTSVAPSSSGTGTPAPPVNSTVGVNMPVLRARRMVKLA